MKRLFLPTILGLALVSSAFILAKPWITLRHAKPIVVKGYAETCVEADSGSLTAHITVSKPKNSDAYNEAGVHIEKVRMLCKEVLGDSYEFMELKTTVSEVLKRNEKGQRTNIIEFYSVRRGVRINSNDVYKLKELGRKLFDMNSLGIRISVMGPELFVTNLEKFKLGLVKEATLNGKKRATLMAESSGEELGSLISARQGVIQITKPNSSATSSWGIYDTETIKKVVKLVVTLEFEISE